MFLFCLFLLISINTEAWNFTPLINGSGIATNAAPTLAYNAGFLTNSSGQVIAVTNNYFLGTVPGASNVMFYLGGSGNLQPGLGTNGFLPSVLIFPDGGTSPNGVGGFPNTLYGPYNNMIVGSTFNLVATNATSTTVTYQFAGTIDGTFFQTNAFQMTFVVPVNSLSPTNGIETFSFTSGGWPAYALQQINNPGAAAMTNLVLEVNGKPGL